MKIGNNAILKELFCATPTFPAGLMSHAFHGELSPINLLRHIAYIAKGHTDAYLYYLVELRYSCFCNTSVF